MKNIIDGALAPNLSHGLSSDQAGAKIEIVRYPATGPAIVELIYSDDKLHRDAKLGPAGIVRDRHTGQVKREEYWEYGYLHRDPHDGPAFIEFDPATGQRTLEEYYFHGKLHQFRADKPAVIVRDAAGQIVRREYWRHGHRLKSPRKTVGAKARAQHTPR